MQPARAHHEERAAELQTRGEPCLADLGWDHDRAAAAAAIAGPGRLAGRVARVDRGACTVWVPAHIRVTSDRHHVATGDWVVVAPGSYEEGSFLVETVLDRRSAFVRQQAGRETGAQVVAANVDTVLIVESLAAGPNLRRIERYLTLGWQSGATPVIVLTKADSTTPEGVHSAVDLVEGVALGADVLPVSAITGDRVQDLADRHLAPGRTAALLGLSGAGKSTLINSLAGAAVVATATTRRDGKGRHTTTHRDLVLLPGRGLLLDTPGMRGIALFDADEGLAEAFSDVEALRAACRFSDCSHHSEPGCAVLAAVADGRLTSGRFESWLKLQRELRSLAARQGDRAVREESLKHWKAISRSNRKRDRRRDR